ncbi:MAG TPA: sigma-70 family RNA polymerase sigma factor [Planctomycetota bacterium]|nr:sigma-70 family RNA polymerase sigma factor [Planctomycetota bacterium]
MTDPQHGKHVHAALAGDAEALSMLWRDHRRWVAAVLLAHMPNGSDLEDLLQDVAVTFCRNLRKLRDPGSFRAWLRAIAVNAARSAGRRRAVQQRVLVPLPEFVDAADPAPARAEHQRTTAERLERVLAILSSMQPDYREPMWLRAVQGLTQQQIAEALGLPVTTVETRLARGRRMLRQAMAPPPQSVGTPCRQKPGY